MKCCDEQSASQWRDYLVCVGGQCAAGAGQEEAQGVCGSLLDGVSWGCCTDGACSP